MKQKILIHLATTTLAVSLALFIAFLALFWLVGQVDAAPPPSLDIPDSFLNIRSLTITSTKTATPLVTVYPGNILTYSIIFTADTEMATVIVTDVVPSLTDFTGIITGTPPTSVTTGILGNTLVWTITDVVTNSVVALTFTTQVSNSLAYSSQITNQAWISTPSTIIATNLVSRNVPVTSTVYLPVILKNYQPPAVLFVFSDNTGGISSVEVRELANNSLVTSCSGIGNNVTVPCGTSFPPGTYRVIAQTAKCGLLQTTITFVGGLRTLRIYCN